MGEKKLVVALVYIECHLSDDEICNVHGLKTSLWVFTRKGE